MGAKRARCTKRAERSVGGKSTEHSAMTAVYSAVAQFHIIQYWRGWLQILIFGRGGLNYLTMSSRIGLLKVSSTGQTGRYQDVSCHLLLKKLFSRKSQRTARRSRKF